MSQPKIGLHITLKKTAMKKLIILFAVVASVFATTQVSAQCAFPKGSLGMNFGFGAASTDSWHYNSAYSYNGFFTPTFNFALDYAFLGNVINSRGSVTAGGYFGIGGGRQKYDSYKYVDNRWCLGTRGALHYTFVRALDTYAGIGIGYTNNKYKLKDSNGNVINTADAPYDGFNTYPFAGAKFMFSENVGVYSELAINHFAWFQIGLALKF